MKNTLQIFIITLLLFSCGSKYLENEVMVTECCMLDIKLDKVDQQKKGNALDNIIEKKIIKTGIIKIEARNITSEKKNIDSLTRKFNAYYDMDSQTSDDNITTLKLTIRIPTSNFESYISGVENSDNNIVDKKIFVEDVTEEYIDLETRLSNKKKYMTQYQELLKKAGSIKDILELQENIRKLEEEIESTTGRLKYLNSQVSFSTLDLEIFQKSNYKYIPEKRDSAKEKLKQSFIGGWYAFVDFLYILLYNWVTLIILAIGVFVLIKFRKKIKKIKDRKGGV